MNDDPYAYQAWICSTCERELVEHADGTVSCDVCQLVFAPRGQTGYAYIDWEKTND